MEARFGNIVFTSNFDSGNLHHVEKVEEVPETGVNPPPADNLSLVIKPDYEFNVWTNHDCEGTVHQNGNRTWFYFGVRGVPPGRLLKINIMNLNKQGRLYSQGHLPFFKMLPGRPKWERIRDRPTYEMIETNLKLSFTHRALEGRQATTYFAFCYPWSYAESQDALDQLDQKYDYCQRMSTRGIHTDSVYYYRELLCTSLDDLRVDLITVSDYNGISDDEEPRFDPRLFPERRPRCKKFPRKRVYFVSSRVHPGETPASFVFNGFLNFILKEDDARAQALRKRYVFKLIPMLNPDGVVRGHYRTDSRGVNLNRMYLDPDPVLYPSVYAAKSVLVYHHVYNRVLNPADVRGVHMDWATLRSESPATWARRPAHTVASYLRTNSNNNASSEALERSSHDVRRSSPPSQPSQDFITALNIPRLSLSDAGRRHSEGSHEANAAAHSSAAHGFLKPLPIDVSSRVRLQQWNGGNVDQSQPGCEGVGRDMIHSLSALSAIGQSPTQSEAGYGLAPAPDPVCEFPTYRARHMSVSSSVASGGECNDIADDQLLRDDDDDGPLGSDTEALGNEGSESDDSGAGEAGADAAACSSQTAHLSDPKLKDIPPHLSGIAFYVDLHGHASKRGCFMYGNSLENEEIQVENILFPRLIALNTAHFDFEACNFTVRNMYLKDRKDGLTKEGAGRVAMWKCLGITHSYTLECNYNMGRIVNSIPVAYGDGGRATPPPLAAFPPKYTTAHFEEVGRAMAIAALDMYDANPWSRIGQSEFGTIQGFRDWGLQYVRRQRGPPRPSYGIRPSRSGPQRGAGPSSSSSGGAITGPLVPRVATLAKRPDNLTNNSVHSSGTVVGGPKQPTPQQSASNLVVTSSKEGFRPVFLRSRRSMPAGSQSAPCPSTTALPSVAPKPMPATVSRKSFIPRRATTSCTTVAAKASESHTNIGIVQAAVEETLQRKAAEQGKEKEKSKETRRLYNKIATLRHSLPNCLPPPDIIQTHYNHNSAYRSERLMAQLLGKEDRRRSLREELEKQSSSSSSSQAVRKTDETQHLSRSLTDDSPIIVQSRQSSDLSAAEAKDTTSDKPATEKNSTVPSAPKKVRNSKLPVKQPKSNTNINNKFKVTKKVSGEVRTEAKFKAVSKKKKKRKSDEPLDDKVDMLTETYHGPDVVAIKLAQRSRDRRIGAALFSKEGNQQLFPNLANCSSLH